MVSTRTSSASSRSARRGIGFSWLLIAAACGGGGDPATPAEPTAVVGFQLSGDPEQSNGATWTYRATANGVAYDLQGILYKPRGAGPFPAVIISHGAGGNVNAYSRGVASTMVQWGLVAIATNYTHAAGVPLGAPGLATDEGASTANIQRARKVVDLLGALGYVDTKRIAAHGHSMGAFVTAATVGAYPSVFRAASHTAGGSVPDGTPNASAPTESQVRGITTPYQMHHGDADVVVALSADQRLAASLTNRGVANELYVYPGATHPDVANNSSVFTRVRAWYQAHGVLSP